MNWYKEASLWEEIERYGPYSTIDPESPEEYPRMVSMAKRYGITPEELINRIKDSHPDSNRNPYLAEFSKRDYFSTEYGWSVPSKEAIEELKEFVGGDQVVEIGSGHGLWAKLMQDIGIQVTPTDYFEGRGEYTAKKDSFTEVEDLQNLEALQKYSGYNVLMMSWPPYDSPMANETLSAFKGNKLIFIGEGYGGCTADDDFFDQLEKEWERIKGIQIPKWEGIHDGIDIWVRK